MRHEEGRRQFHASPFALEAEILDDAGTITIRGLPFDRERYVAELTAAGIEVPHWLASA